MATTGIDARHARSCRSRGGGGRCNCTPTYRARVFDARSGQRRMKTFPTLAAAKTWRQDAVIALRSGGLVPARTPTVADALDALIEGMESGQVLDRTGKPYKPATCRSYRVAADGYLKLALGRWRLSELRRRDVQDLVDELRARGLAASTIHNKIDPLRVLYRRALHRDEVTTRSDTRARAAGEPRAPRPDRQPEGRERAPRSTARRRSGTVGGRAVRRPAHR